MIWHALILAGSRGVDDPVAIAAKVSHKAFAVLDDRPMIGYVTDALTTTDLIGDIAVSIEPDAPELPDNMKRLDAASSPAFSVLAAIDQLTSPILVTTADNPLLTAETITSFLKAAEGSGADICAGVATRAIVEGAGNPARRTYLRFEDDELSGCNLFALKNSSARAAIEFWRQVETERKRPWRIASKIGFVTLLRYLIGRLQSDKAVERLGKVAGCKAALIRLDDVYAAHDVDKADDLLFVEGVLKERNVSV